MIALISIAIAGAVTRLVDGATQPMPGVPFSIPNGARVAVLAALCGAAWWLTCGVTGIAAWGALWCLLALVVGHTVWQDWLWSPMRFALFGCAAGFLAPEWLWYVPLVMCAAGLTAPALFWIDGRVTLPRWWILDGPEAYSRLFIGAACCTAPLWLPIFI